MTNRLSGRRRAQRLFLLRGIQDRELGFSVPVDGQTKRAIAVNHLAEFYANPPQPAFLATSDEDYLLCGLLVLGIWGDLPSMVDGQNGKE